SNLTLARSVPAHRLGLSFGVKQAAIPLATLLAGAAVPAVALTVGWRWAYVIAAGLAVLALVGAPRAGEPYVRIPGPPPGARAATSPSSRAAWRSGPPGWHCSRCPARRPWRSARSSASAWAGRGRG